MDKNKEFTFKRNIKHQHRDFTSNIQDFLLGNSWGFDANDLYLIKKDFLKNLNTEVKLETSRFK